MIILDTHILIWAVCGERKLGRRAHALIEQHWGTGMVAVSALTFWEIGMLQERGRLQLPTAINDWRNELLTAGLTEIPLDGAIAIRALDLSGLPGDPADRFIVATALEQGAALMTADQKLLHWRHPLERHDGTA